MVEKAIKQEKNTSTVYLMKATPFGLANRFRTEWSHLANWPLAYGDWKTAKELGIILRKKRAKKSNTIFQVYQLNIPRETDVSCVSIPMFEGMDPAM